MKVIPETALSNFSVASMYSIVALQIMKPVEAVKSLSPCTRNFSEYLIPNF